MMSVNLVVQYVFLFFVLYFQVFLLYSFLEEKYNEKNFVPAKKKCFGSVSIIVPCFNEGKTVEKTIRSLFALEYPKEKLNIIVVDDGSTDNTSEVLKNFQEYPNVTCLRKENQGGKYHALNYALGYVTTEFVGCLDADSRVDKNALEISMSYFSDAEVSAVVPSLLIDEPRTILQYLQKVEYELGIFLRRALSVLSALYIAPGPFSLFRKSVFETLGPYREAHHTEDLEIALRIQISGGKLAYAKESLVYTIGPTTVTKLIRQRIRWISGFLKNMVDYRFTFFRPRYGHLGMVILPFSVLTIVSVLYIVPAMITQSVFASIDYAQNIAIAGFNPTLNFDWFFFDIRSFLIFSTPLLFMIVVLYIGRKTVRSKFFSWDVFSVFIYPYLSIIWTFKSVWNTVASKKTTWR